jgi:hypothetical protein
MSETPRLYPVTIDLTCPDHGHVQRLTVNSLAAQRAWTEHFQDRHHDERAGCVRGLTTTVPV